MQLAVFDLDGTITRRDTLVLYVLGFLKQRPWRWLGLPRVVPAAAKFAVGQADHGDLKAALIKATLSGATRAELADWTARFIREQLEVGLFSQAREKITSHRHNGDRLVLMSASVDLYVPDVGRALGFHETICTGIEWKGDRLVGNLTTPNRRGEEKARCFKALQERYPGVESAAYGNAGSDLPHWPLASHGFLVKGPASARRSAQQLGVACVNWQ